MARKMIRFTATPEKLAEIRASVDWARLDAMTEEEIEAGIAADPDASPPMTDAEITAARVQWIRNRLGLSQPDFAREFRIPVGTLRDWEQGRREPDAASWAYLRVIEHAPDTVRAALAGPPRAA